MLLSWSPRRRILVAAAAFGSAVATAGTPSGAAPAAEQGGPTSPAVAEKQGKKEKLAAAEALFARAAVPRLRIEVAPPELEKLRRNGREYVTATVRETVVGDGAREAVYTAVGLHLKGGPGSYRGVDDPRPGLTLNFEKFAADGSFHGLEKIHLNNSVQDPSYMSENLGNALFREAGIPAARVGYARVWLNERELGLFVLKEGFDDAFLRQFFDEPGGTLYEGAFKDVDGGLPERVNKAKKNPAKFKELADAARESDPAVRRRKLGAALDVDRFLTYMAMESLTAHWDGYCANLNNYRVYHDPAGDRLVFLPHGTDQLFQNVGFPLVHGRGMAARAVTDAADDKFAYLDRVAELRQKVYSPENLNRKLDEVAARLAPAMAELGADAARRHKEQTESLRQRLLERVKNVDQQLAATPRPVKFDAAGVASLSGARWAPRVDGGKAVLDRVDEGGRPRLRIRNDGGECTASYRTGVLLTKGSYVLEAPCRTAGVAAPAGQNAGAGVRISGGRRDAGLSGNADWRPTEFAFEVTEPTREVVLVCELKATAGEAAFDLEKLMLRRR